MERLVALEDVYKIYNAGENEVRALDGVSMEINEGEFVTIVGSSGSGKSTLMHMLGCLDAPTKGRYLLGGMDAATMKDNAQSEIRNKKIGFIFQGFHLIPGLSAMENVELPLLYRGVGRTKRKEMVLQALERVKLLDRKNHKPAEMSGGQQQRVAIARAIAARPPILLADEPTGNLDSKSGQEVLDILHELHQEGNTIVLITHDNRIARSGQRVVTIVDGKIVSDVSASEYS